MPDFFFIPDSCAGRFGQTLIMVTHDPGIAAQADQTLQIQDGRLL